MSATSTGTRARVRIAAPLVGRGHRGGVATMTTQTLIERLAELQLREQEHKTRAAEYDAECARLRLEYTRRMLALPPVNVPPTPAGMSS